VNSVHPTAWHMLSEVEVKPPTPTPGTYAGI
jgi:hypothetical protein